MRALNSRGGGASSAAAAGVSSSGCDRPEFSRPANGRTRPSASSSRLNRPMRRDRPGSGASSTGAAVATASETMETLSSVTTIASASASRPKYGFSPVHVPDPAAERAPAPAASAARAARPVRRDGVSASPTRSRRIIGGELRRRARRPPAASSRNRPLLPPTSTATSGRGRCARRGAQSRAASRQPRRRHPVQRGAGDDHVRAGQPVMPVGDHHDRSAAGPCAGAAPAPRARPRPAQRGADRAPPCRRSRSGVPAAGLAPAGRRASGAGQSRAGIQRQGARGASTRRSRLQARPPRPGPAPAPAARQAAR